MTCAAPDSKIPQATSKIDNAEPVTTLYCTVLEIQLDKRIAEAEAAARPEGQTDTDDFEISKQQRFNPDIRQFLQAERAAHGTPSCMEIQSMIVQ